MSDAQPGRAVVDRLRLGGDRASLALVLMVGAVAIGRAVQIANGAWEPDAFRWISLALGMALAGTLLVGRAVDRFTLTALPMLLGMGLAFQFAMLMTAQPGVYLRHVESAPLAHFYYGLAVASVVAGTTLWSSGWFSKLSMPLLIATHLFLGAWILRASPEPVIDVFHIHRESLAAFLRGENPYTLTFANIYGNAQYFGPGMVENGRLMFGFTYPPVSLYLALPGHVLMGDYRYSLLVASAAAGALMAFSRPGPFSKAIAAVYLFTPRHFFVLEQGWTEPFVVFLFALTVFVACRAPRWLWVPLGLLVVAKQYVLIAIPAAVLLRPLFPSWKAFGLMIVKGAAVAGVLTLPLALWNWPAFYRDLVGIQLGLPFRTDALSFPVWWLVNKQVMAPAGLSLALTACIALIIWLRAPKTVSGFAWAAVGAFFPFFVFRQSFCNYYFLVIGCLCVAAASLDLRENK